MGAKLVQIYDDLSRSLSALSFRPPIACVYNPLMYARAAHNQYLRRYGIPKREVILVGMNPGPWGMAQTGVPFGEISIVRDWLGIEAPIEQPPVVHPKRPIEGFQCKRREVSGQRLWGWARDRFETPQAFFERFFVANYCPLLFIDENGANRTPDRLAAADKKMLLAVCDHAIKQLVDCLDPSYVIGVGKFAQKRLSACLPSDHVIIGGITHPSPANPRANKGWAPLITQELVSLGVLP